MRAITGASMSKKLSATALLILLTTYYSQVVSWHCDVIPLAEMLKNNSHITYTQCQAAFPFKYKKIPLADDHFLHPYQGTFKETFFITIPQGTVFGLDGWVLIDDTLINELIWQRVYLAKDELQKAKQTPLIKKNGRVAVIAQFGYFYYYHWMLEILGRLALLEMQGIEYDFLYVPITAPFMRESLDLWGIDPNIIIDASNDFRITADELIVPSLVSDVTIDGISRLAHYIPSYIVHYIKAKLLHAAEQKKLKFQHDKKIFISRKDASSRKIINEDELFALLKTKGFKRYYLTQMSLLEQISLFHNAEIIISSVGSGLTNILFCNPNVQLIELYQARRDTTIWNLSQMVGIHNHLCIKTIDFIDEREGQYDTIIPLDIIKNLPIYD